MKEILRIALTGHRPPKLAGYDYKNKFYINLYKKLNHIIEKALEEYSKLELHSGMALGADTIWAKSIIDMKKKYPDRIIFIADVPSMEQYKLWFPESKELWEKLIAYADEIRTYDDKNIGKSYAYILNARNWGMIEPCEILIAIYNGDKTGGTANAVKYGKSKNKKIIYIPPDTLR